jgi:hypothetical protein
MVTRILGLAAVLVLGCASLAAAATKGAFSVSDLPKLTNFLSFSHGSFRSFGFANVWGGVYYFLIFRLG